MPQRADLIIVGAGPAGSATAFHAARAGLDVIFLDRQEFPRDKPCGDGLMPHATSELAMMGLGDWLPQPGHGRFEGFTLYTQSAVLKQAVPPTQYGPYGYVIPRLQTDSKLLEQAKAAGAEFQGNVKATELLRSSAGNVTAVEATSNGETLRFEAPLVVVADGSGGGFAGKDMKAPQNAVARRQYFSGVSWPDQNNLQIFLTKDMNQQGAGYGWIFYFGDGMANVGAGISTKTLGRSSYSLHEIFERFLMEPEVAKQLRGARPEGPAKSWSLKMGMWGAKRYSQGVILAGDAGSMIHPISGEGVGYALESGRLAASWAHEAHSRKDFSSSLLAGYERQLYRKRAKEHLSGYAMVNLLPNLSLLEPFFKACESDPAARRTLIESFTGDAPVYNFLKHPGTIANAVRTTVMKTG